MWEHRAVKTVASKKRMAAACAALGLLATTAVAGAAAVHKQSGDPQAIAFYKLSRAAMASYEGITFRGGGTSYRIIHTATGDTFKFDFGTTPKGYSSAVAHVRVVQRNGRVIEEIDTLDAPGKPPLRLWQSRGTEIGALLTKKPCPELVPTNTASFATIGHPYVGLSGHFAPLTAAGSQRVVASTYALAGGVAHERDTINASTHLWSASHLVVLGGPYNHNFLTESGFAYSRTQRYVPPPLLAKCR